MIIEDLKGCGTALVTPFDTLGCVDFACYERLVDRQIKAGIHFLVALGTTAETPTLSPEEKIRLLQIAVERARHKVPVVVGVGSNNTDQVIQTIAQFDTLGADAYLVVTPYYNKPTQEGLYRHFSAIASHSSKPIMLYNVPGRTGVNLTAATTIRLSAHPNIVAVKEASGNYAQINEVINNAAPGFKVFSGNDNETLSLMATGADGVISVASNAAPRQMVALAEALMRLDLLQARALNKQLTPLFTHCFVESNPIPVKAAMALLGLMEPVMRLPLTAATEATNALMQQTLTQLSITE